MDPTTRVFVPLQALNPPPAPRFMRDYNELVRDVARLQEWVETLVNAEPEDSATRDRAWLQIRRLDERLLVVAKNVVSIIQRAHRVGQFCDPRDFSSDVTECMLLCHKYSWALIVLINFVLGADAWT